MKTTRLNTCNVLSVGAETRRLWQFGINNREPHLNAEHDGQTTEPLPPRWVTKSWRSLWQPKINLAWLPPEQVFLRVIQLPAGEPSELPAMVELQLEKLSPLPVGQVVWSFQPLPNPTGNLQTVIVIIVPRDFVDEFLVRLEGQGYLADRLELPLLHQLLAVPAEDDSVWIIPSTVEGKKLCLVAWWNAQTLVNVNLLQVTGDERWSALLTDQLTQLSWAGETEGWLPAHSRCHLIADAATAAQWEPVLSQWAGEAVTVTPALSEPELATLNARRVARDESQINLLPVEYSTRYRQQFVDGLWMGGLGALAVLYVVGVLIYLAAVQVLHFQKNRLESNVTALANSYTNAMQLQARVDVLQDQVNLRYAALECWRAACVLLPSDLTLSSLWLDQGRKLTLFGTAPTDQEGQIIAFNDALAKYRTGGTNGTFLFSHVHPYTTRGSGSRGNVINWDFACELNRSDLE